MEHRCDHRKLLTLEIVINDRQQGEIRGKTRNVSLSGMLVDISETPLSLNTIIDISFPVDCGDESRECSAKAFVVHQQAGSVGLMFSEVDSGVRQMLRKLIFGYATVTERAYHSHKRPEITVGRAVA
ncbi:MAG: PilZ domain-containing protein [Candidatus Thiodiazotropha sp. (ex Monitilora ramsayi)]|nr:PilZ domain-containing protein [Candidatus Thiodiazotropha sp. (ex Monitilora ramsayi)]